MKHSMLATVLLAAAAAQAQDVPKIDPQRLSQDVKTLASDEFEGRGPNTAPRRRSIARRPRRSFPLSRSRADSCIHPIRASPEAPARFCTVKMHRFRTRTAQIRRGVQFCIAPAGMLP